MKTLLLLLVVLLTHGCVSTEGLQENTGLLHENSESQLLTEAEFMERVSQSATLIYERMRAISNAADQYAIQNNGKLPSGNFKDIRLLLVEEGYLNSWPSIPPFALTKPGPYEFRYVTGYGDMDGLPPLDDVIFAQDLKLEVCEAFARRYSSFGPDDIVHDYQANGDRAPGETLGKHMTVYAMIWEKTTRPDYCDIIWIMQYNDASERKSKRVPEK